MKRLAVLLVALVLLSGCITSTTNTRTTQYLDGRVITEEISDDGVYYQEASKFLGAGSSAITCPTCTPGELVAMEAFRTIRVVMGGGFPARGMNGFELAAKVSGDIREGLPAIGLLSAVRYLAKRPNSVQFNGDGNAYNVVDTVGTGNTATIPLFSPPTTTTTTYAPQ